MNLPNKQNKKPEMPHKERLDKLTRWSTHHKLIYLKLVGTDPIYLDLLDRLDDKDKLFANFGISFCLVAKEIGVDKCLAVCNTYDFVRNSPIWREKRGEFRRAFFNKFDEVKAKGILKAKFRDAKKLDPSLTWEKFTGSNHVDKKPKKPLAKPQNKFVTKAKQKTEVKGDFKKALKKVSEVVIVRKKVVPK